MLTDRFAPGAIGRLCQKTFIAGGEHHEEIGSTNDRAGELVAAGLVETPFLVLCDRQTAGRGRGANVWWSSAGALTFTLVIDPHALNLAPAKLGLASLATALAIASAVRQLNAATAPRLKWPNDVYLAGRKLAGVLVEIPPMRPEKLVIGVGMNVNNSFAGAAREMRDKAVSLVEATSIGVELEALLGELIHAIDLRLRALGNDAASIVNEFRENCLLTGRPVTLLMAAGTVRGECLGIDAEGALRLATENGEQKYFAGVVSEF